MDDTAVSIDNLTFAYNAKEDTVLNIKQWRLAKGEKVFLSGASGSGKSTLLNLIAGTLTPSQGKISLLDKPFSELSASKRDQLRARHIGIVFQQLNLIPYLTVRDNIRLAVCFAKKTHTAKERDLIALLQQLGLSSSLLSRRASELSVGQQQRVAIARALINKPELIVVDEPTSALDREARDAFMNVLMQAACDSAMIFVSHDPTLATYFSRHDKIEAINANAQKDVSVC